jgi:hypothetical protein
MGCRKPQCLGYWTLLSNCSQVVPASPASVLSHEVARAQSKEGIHREVVSTDGIRAGLTTFRDRLFPDRQDVPKTLLFAKARCNPVHR